MIKKSEKCTTTFVLQWSGKGRFQPTWKIEKEDVIQSNNNEKDGKFSRSRVIRPEASPGVYIDTISFNSATASIKSLSIISVNGEDDATEAIELRTSLATVRIYHQGRLAEILSIANAKWVNNFGSCWKIVQFNAEGEAAIVDTVFGNEPQEAVTALDSTGKHDKNDENEEQTNKKNTSTDVNIMNNAAKDEEEVLNDDADDDYTDDDYEDEEYDDDWD